MRTPEYERGLEIELLQATFYPSSEEDRKLLTNLLVRYGGAMRCVTGFSIKSDSTNDAESACAPSEC